MKKRNIKSEKIMMNSVKMLLALLAISLVNMPLIYSEESCDQEENQQPCLSSGDEYDGVDVFAEDCWYAALSETDCQWARRQGMHGIWLPECPPAMSPFLADPRQINMSGGWRFHDRIISQEVIDFSFGDIFPVYRWINIWYFGGDLQFDIEGGVWDVFAPLEENSPMVNADYYMGFPVTYVFGKWAIRLRGYHISTHLGDEFLCENPDFIKERKNFSSEFLDLFVSHQFTNDIRLYAGVGWVCLQDESFKCGEWYAQGGVELHMTELGYRDYCNRLYGQPYYAMHFRYDPVFTNHVDATYALGYEWGKFSGLRRKFRLYFEYHDGYSLEGQFCKLPTNYFSVRMSYGW